MQNKRGKEYKEYVRGWGEYFRPADMKGVLKKTDEWTRCRIQSIQSVYWKQSKTVRTRD